MSALVETERPQKVVPVAASLNGVMHRYGKTVALELGDAGDSRRLYGRTHRARRRRQIDSARAHRRGTKDPDRRGAGARWRPQGHSVPAGRLCAHRLHAARSRAQSLPHAQRVRKSGLHRPPVRPGGGGAQGAHRRPDPLDRSRSVPRPARRQAFRRHEAEAVALLLADSRSRSPYPRRTDDRGRSALAAAVLGADRPHPCDAGRR